jgi:hypothetical protein
MRWQLEVTFQEVRRHLGFETQRQWSDSAIRRTTPALLGLFSLVTLFAHRQMRQAADVFRQAAWYHKAHPTFTDALGLVRKELRDTPRQLGVLCRPLGFFVSVSRQQPAKKSL